MKYITLICLAILCACSVDQKKKNPFGDQLKVNSKGLDFKEVSIYVNGEKDQMKVFNYGDEIELRFDGVEGFTQVGGKVFPGLKIAVLNQKQDTVFATDDLYSAEAAKGIDFKKLLLYAKLTLGDPMFSGELLTAKMHFWDKKGTASMDVDFEFSSKSNEFLEIKKRNLNYREVYLYSQKLDKVIADNHYMKGDKLYFFFQGLNGFKENAGLIYPCLSIEVKNERDEVILKLDNLLEQYYEIGVEPDLLEESLYFSINEEASASAEKLKIHAVLLDKLSSNSIIFNSTLESRSK